MCCRADEISIKLLFSTFNQFSAVSGLHANLDKSSLYIAGVDAAFKEKILVDLGLILGTLPFKYLGVPLSTRKLSIQQCMPIVEKMIARVKCWSSKLLSYSGRLQLVKSVLFEMQTYWAQIFLLPKKILTLVTTVCRTFLWTGSNEFSRRALIAWETVCMPQRAGELVIELIRWNKAALCKLLWAIEQKQDRLWVLWIHTYYIKNKSLDTLQVPKQASWLVRKIFEAKKWLNGVGTV